MLVKKILEFVAAVKAGDLILAGRILSELLALLFQSNTAFASEDQAALQAAMAEADTALGAPAATAIGDGKLLEKLLKLWDIIKLFI